MYNDEGQYSPVGSLESCCILEAENDLGFLKDLDYKFGNLATVCSPPPLQPKFEEVEQIAESVETSIKSESSVATSAVQIVKSDSPPPQKSTISSVTETQHINASGSMNTGSTLLAQQQPLYCLVEHQAPSTVIFAEEPVQGMYLINGLAGTQGLVLHGGNILQNTLEQQGMYLIDGMSMLQGNIMLGPNLVNAASLPVPSAEAQGETGKQSFQSSQGEQPGQSEDKAHVGSGKEKSTKPAKMQVKSKR